MSERGSGKPGVQFDQLSWGNILKVLVILLLSCGIIFSYFHFVGNSDSLVYVLVCALGALLGLTELLGRYTDSPAAAIKAPGAFIYVLVNAVASGLALYLILRLAPDITNPVYQVLLAGLGAMAFLRSALFKARIADQDVAVGPAIVLDTLLKFADAQVDRGRAVDRAARIASVIGELPIAQAGDDLPRLCFALMQNLPVDVRQRLLDDITLVVTDVKRSEPVKVMEIGLVLWNRVGIGTLIGAVELLKTMPSAKKAIATAAAEDIVPPTPRGTPADLLPEITEQLAKDRQAAGTGRS